MPFTDPVPSMNGRNSRSSNVSAMTGASRSNRSGPPPPQSNDMLSNAGVLSMLKTSTDSGDIGALSFNSSRLPTMPRQAHARRAHSSRPSASSHPNHHYAPSQTSRMSDSTTHRRGSLGSMQSIPPSLPQVALDKLPLQVPAPTLDSRAYSLTAAQGPQPLPRHRSATSLKSAGHEPVRGSYLHPGQIPPPMPENRAPYIYPTRLKRPGYRSPSPALSDVSGQVPTSVPAPPQRRQAPFPGPPMARPQLHSYNSDYAADYGLDGRPMNPRLPPRAVQGGPPMAYDHAYRAQPPQAMPMHPPAPRVPPSFAHGAPAYQRYGPPRPPPTHPAYAQRAAHYPHHPPMQYPGHPHPPNRGLPPATLANAGNSMFHNAARMARQLPVRTDTPLPDLDPPSSDPPSSGTAPSSSNPPTPKDQTTIHVAVNPLFIDPTLTDLPDSSSEPVLPGAKYFEYAEGLKSTDDPEIVVPLPSVPPTGLVQRVRAMLESRNAIEGTPSGESNHGHVIAHHVMVDEHDPHQYLPVDEEIHELATHRSPRVTVIEEFEAPVELPASPVQIAELSNSPAVVKHHITRELVQAGLRPSSTASSSQVEAGDTETGFHVNIELNEEPPKGPSVKKQDVSTPDRGTSPTSDTHHEKERSKSVAASAVTVSEPVIVSGMNYALRFSAPIDSTVITSNETQSHDHFALDADTITAQHQRPQEPSTPVVENGGTGRPQIGIKVAEPVSPLQPGEVVNRSSAVSPLCTHTLPGEDSLAINTDADADDVSEVVHNDWVNSSPESSAPPPPPAPRTPRTYSKSVSLPQKEHTAASTPSSHRFSLPPDMSTVGETTMNTTLDLVTDVAVRFSLPTTTITIGKPQIITIPPSSSPEKPAASPPREQNRLEPRAMKRNSVTFADQVAPLNIKKAAPRRASPPVREKTTVTSKSVSHRPSPVAEDRTESSFGSRESPTELRFPPSALNGRFGSTHLTRLKEESVEDMSISDHHAKRSSELQPGFKFPLPARIAAVKAMQERRLQESAEKAKARRLARHQARTLAEIRDLPSLNFSRMDLIDKLNQALEVRPSKSMEVALRREHSAIHCPSPQRPMSTGPLRDRYTSFFNKPEDFSSWLNECADESVQSSQTSLVPCGGDVPKVEVQDPTEADESVAGEGPRAPSPKDFLSVALQINRLSIPSVSGLSERLTELLPCLKNLHLDSVLATDEDVEHTIEDIQHLGLPASRPETVLSTRTSAGFRTLAERAEEIVMHGTHDSVVPVAKVIDTEKALPSLPESVSAGRVSAINSTDGKQSYLSGSVSAPSDLGKDVTRPPSALVRVKSPTTEDEVRALLPPESNPIARGAKRHLISSGASTRPWNQDENYPWSSSNVTIDLNVPSEAHLRDSIATDTLRRTRSVFNSLKDPADTGRGIDIGSIRTDLDSTVSITTEQATGVNPNHIRKHSHKRSIIGSISKKIGLHHSRQPGTSISHNGRSPAGSSSRVRSDDPIPHKPGDRYPTTALTPPAGYIIDEVRSFFSDDSSEKRRTASFRKRLTVPFKGKGKTVRIESGPRGHSPVERLPTAYNAGHINEERQGAVSSAHIYDGIAMGKAEFHLKRFGIKLRNLIARGGDLIRSFSTRSHKPRDDWLSDSAYSST